MTIKLSPFVGRDVLPKDFQVFKRLNQLFAPNQYEKASLPSTSPTQRRQRTVDMEKRREINDKTE